MPSNGSETPAPAHSQESSQSEESQPQSLLQRLISSRNLDISLFLPFLLGFTGAPFSSATNTALSAGTADSDSADESDDESPEPEQNRSTQDQTQHNQDEAPLNPQSSESQSENSESRSPQQTRDRIMLINPVTQGVIVIEGADLSNLASFFEGLPTVKNGQPPASKTSIEAMPTVELKEGKEMVGECAICLDDWEIGQKIVKEMPCQHRFHGDCIEKWLGMHGSCPVCRYKMPVEEETGQKKTEQDEEGVESRGGQNEERRRIAREIWVSFGFRRNGGESGDGNDNME